MDTVTKKQLKRRAERKRKRERLRSLPEEEWRERKQHENKKKQEQRNRQWERINPQIGEFITKFFCVLCQNFLVFPTRVENCQHVFCKRWVLPKIFENKWIDESLLMQILHILITIKNVNTSITLINTILSFSPQMSVWLPQVRRDDMPIPKDHGWKVDLRADNSNRAITSYKCWSWNERVCFCTFERFLAEANKKNPYPSHWTTQFKETKQNSEEKKK